MFDEVKDRCRRHYENSLAQYGDSPEGVNWRDTESQRLRFQLLCQVADLNGKRIHDVGCGLGHLLDFLSESGISCEYVGSDISPFMVRAAKERLPTGRLYVADILEDDEEWMQADYLVTSGLFYVKSATDNDTWKQFVQTILLRMFSLASRGIAFNMLTSYVDYEDPNLFYQAPGETMDFCIKNMNRRVIIRHDYPLWEYTAYVYR